MLRVDSWTYFFCMIVRFLFIVIALCVHNFIWTQCVNAPNIDSLDQPTCSNQFGVIYLSGLPPSGWTINSLPPGFTQSGVGPIAVITNLTPGGSFSFDYFDAVTGCTSIPSSSVNINAVPAIPQTPIAGVPTQPTCALATGSVTLINLPNSGGWTVTVIGTNPASSNTISGLGTSVTISNLTVNAYSFNVTSNSTGCTSANSNTVFINSPVNPAAPIVGAIIQPNCLTNSGSVNLSGLPAVGPWTVFASPGGQTLAGSGSTGVFSGLTPGASYTFTVVNSASCTSAVSLSAVINPAVAIPITPTFTLIQPTCPLPTGTISVTTPLGGGFTYSINGATYQASPNFGGLSAGNYTVFVQNTSSGCVTSNPVPASINPVPQPPAISVAVINNVTCFGANDGWAVGVVDSLGTPPFIYSWAPGSIANDTASNLSPGNYNFAVIDAANCLVVTGITITEPAPLAIVGDSTPINCATGQLGTMQVTVSGGIGPYNYLWAPLGQTGQSISNLNTGNYSVVVFDANNCQIAFSSSIGIINALPISLVPGDTTINPGTSFTAGVVNLANGSILWTPNQGLSCDDCPNPLVAPDTTTVYYASVTDANGCTGSDSMLVTVKLLCGEFFVPTIFSPNGTGPDENDELRVFGKEVCVKDFSWVIYDRWGQKVFESVNINMTWDGFYKGRPAQEGNYVFDLSLQLYDDTIIRKSGSLSLVR